MKSPIDSIRRYLAIAALCAPMVSVHAQQQTILVPYPAGQLSDIIARTVRDGMARQGNASSIVENVAGATGAIGAQRVLTAGLDGNMLLLASPNEVILAPLANAAVKYRPEEFSLVSHVAVAPLVLITRQDLSAETVDDFSKLVRNKSEAKQPLSFGSVGIGSLYHFMGEHMSKVLNAELNHIPYKGGAALIGDLVGSRLDFATIPYSPMLQGLVDQGKIKLLASVGSSRPSVLQKLPTVGESSSLRGYAFEIWTGFMVPSSVPAPLRSKWHSQIGQALADPQVRSALEAQGLTISKPMTLDALERLYSAEIDRYRRLANVIKLTPQ